MEGIQQTDLIALRYSKQNKRMQGLHQRLSHFPKYFFNQRESALVIYDKTNLYVVHKQEMKNFNLAKQYLISELSYNLQKDIVVFLTGEGQLCAHFLVTKVSIVIRKDIKKAIFFEWVYGVQNIFQFFIADESGVRLYKVDEQKKVFKEIKNLSGKYNSFHYDPLTETLVGFPVGDCKQIHPFVFNQSKYNNWFKLNPVSLDFSQDEYLVELVKNQKSLCLDWSKNNKQVFSKHANERYFTNLIKINKRCFLIFFYAEEGLLKITAISQEKERETSIKLPSDSIPDFFTVDGMLVVNLKLEKITFIYDLNGSTLQPLVSPHSLRHKEDGQIKNIYQSEFFSEKVIHPNGMISKYEVQLQVIFNYLKNQLQIFDFFIKRKGAKMQLLKWLRKDLFKIKEINLSKFWKSLFLKFISNIYPQTEVINLIDLFSNIFYTLSLQELIPKEKLLNVILECIRQALELKMPIAVELQLLVFDLLMEFKRYQLLVYLLHNEVIKDCKDILKKITEEYMKNHDIILGTLAIDMTSRIGNEKDLLKILMKFERVRDAKKYIKQNYSKIETLYLIQVGKYIKNEVVLFEYLRYIKSFILLKFPTMNITYLNQAEQKILSKIQKFKQNDPNSKHKQSQSNKDYHSSQDLL